MSKATQPTFSGIHKLQYHAETLYLFTRADYVTLFFPVTLFASVVGPIYSFERLIHAAFWIWLHLLQCNVSNQCHGVVGDTIDKPWRPIPAGRLTLEQATRLRWCLFVACIALSAYHKVILTSCGLAAYMIMYDQLDLDYHWSTKQLCNVLAYFVFQIGGTQVASGNPNLDTISVIAAVSIALVILTTIHASDFCDIEGDTKQGRKTIPIVWPNASRPVIFATLVFWSLFFSIIWRAEFLGGLFVVALGSAVGWRFWKIKTPEEDKISYLIYNIWLVCLHILPINARLSKLAWM